MEVIVSAIMGELAARSISFVIDRYLKRTAPTTDDDESLHSLQRLLLRVHAIVEEAEGRRITNHAILRQLDTLREEMYRGYHVMDYMSRHSAGEERRDAGDGEVSHSFAMSRFSPAKRVCLMIRSSSSSGQSDGKLLLQQVVGSLQTIVADVSEFVTFLTGCPRLGQEPYNMYMFMDKCMFSRQMEMERVVAFLLQTEGDGTPGVLPISGPRRAGKSTLVEHACNDERVRDHFSQIISLTRGDLGDENAVVTLRSCGGVVKHRRRALDDGRVLVIVELDGDRNSKSLDWTITEGLLGRFYSACKSRMPSVSKIIVTSRSDKIACLGTTQPLRLQPLTQEAYWYFLKVRTFGSTDAAEHPKMLSIAMDMAAEMDGSFAAANIFGGLLKSNFDARFWSLTLAILREFKKRNLFRYDAQQTNPNLEVTKLAHTPKITEEFVFLDDYQIGSCAHGEVPKVSLQDVLFGGARPRGKFDVFAWKSPIPPHYSYAYSCEIRRAQRVVARKKRLMHKIGS